MSAFKRLFSVAYSQQLGCNATVSSSSAMGNMMHHFESEKQYRCSSVMANSTGCNNVVDEGQQAKHQQHKGSMFWINVMLLLRSIARAHYSLRGSVDFG